jgi:hypothetical protein
MLQGFSKGGGSIPAEGSGGKGGGLRQPPPQFCCTHAHWLIVGDQVPDSIIEYFGLVSAAVARLSYLSLKVSGRRRNTPKLVPEAFGVVACRFVATVAGILGLVWPRFRLKLGYSLWHPGQLDVLATMQES